MLYQISYLIRPNQALLTYFAAAPDFALFFVREPIIWLREVGGFRVSPVEEDIHAIKLLFLAQYRSDILRLELKDKETVLKELMGDPPFGTDIFDKWWEIEQIDFIEEFRNGFARIALEQLDLLGTTGNATLDNWLKDLRKLKSENVI